MKKQLIVVVHGVGVKEAGVSSDLLAVSVADKGLQPVSSDDFNNAEDVLHNEADKIQVFPCRIRQYAGSKRKRVIADFYWGDITNSKIGFLGLWIAIFKTIMGLGHVIRESAKEVYRESDQGRSVASFIVKVLHGPIVAINLVMLAGVLIASFLELLTEEPGGGELSPLIIGAIAIIGGLALRGRARSYLERLLWCWVVISGAFVLLLQIVPLVMPQNVEMMAGLERLVGNLICTTDGDKCREVVSGIYLDGILLLIFVQLCSLLNLLLLLALTVCFQKSKHETTSKPVPSLVFPSVVLMTVMWIFFIACLWSLTITPWWELIPHGDIQNFGLRILLAVVPILVCIAVVSVFVLLNRIAWAGRLRQHWQGVQYFDDEIENAELHRVIVSPKISVLMYLSFVLFTLLSIYILLPHAAVELLNQNELIAHVSTLIEMMGGYYKYMIGFVIASVIAITGFAYLVRDGIDVATDIITYLNDYSWKTGKSDEEETQTYLEKWLSLKMPPVSKTGYYNRKRIKMRLELLVAKLVKQEKPDEIYIVSHSQGTVIAMDVIDEYGSEWRKSMKSGARFGLVTMGSPYTHIYNHYFPSSFPDVSSRKGLQPVGNGGILDNWINIFRVDDFVGTHIDPDGIWPKEHPVLPNGHTSYWVDVNVARILQSALKF